MSSSLNNLASYSETYDILNSQFQNIYNKKIKLSYKTGVFPYNYLDCKKKLKETNLPTEKEYYDVLRGEFFTHEDYTRAQHIWSMFNIKNLGEYSDLHLKTDLMLLTEVKIIKFSLLLEFNYNLICIGTFTDVRTFSRY